MLDLRMVVRVGLENFLAYPPDPSMGRGLFNWEIRFGYVVRAGCNANNVRVTYAEVNHH